MRHKNLFAMNLLGINRTHYVMTAVFSCSPDSASSFLKRSYAPLIAIQPCPSFLRSLHSMSVTQGREDATYALIAIKNTIERQNYFITTCSRLILK